MGIRPTIRSGGTNPPSCRTRSTSVSPAGRALPVAPVFLTSFVTSQGLFLAQLCAAAFVVSLPVLVAGFAAQDKLVQGLSLGSVK